MGTAMQCPCSLQKNLKETQRPQQWDSTLVKGCCSGYKDRQIPSYFLVKPNIYNVAPIRTMASQPVTTDDYLQSKDIQTVSSQYKPLVRESYKFDLKQSPAMGAVEDDQLTEMFVHLSK